MNRRLFIPTVAIIAFALSSFPVQPVQSVQAGGCLHDKHHKFFCPKCDCDCSTCSLQAEEVDVEKKCFEVECKTICIPKVVFPWQKKQSSCHSCDSCHGRGCTNCVHNGARVRKVKVLKTKKYKCPECRYTWTPDVSSRCCATGSCGNGSCGCDVGCGDASCDGGCCDSNRCDSGCDSGMTFEASVPVEMFNEEAGNHYMPMQDLQHSPSLAPVVVE